MCTYTYPVPMWSNNHLIPIATSITGVRRLEIYYKTSCDIVFEQLTTKAVRRKTVRLVKLTAAVKGQRIRHWLISQDRRNPKHLERQCNGNPEEEDPWGKTQETTDGNFKMLRVVNLVSCSSRYRNRYLDLYQWKTTVTTINHIVQTDHATKCARMWHVS